MKPVLVFDEIRAKLERELPAILADRPVMLAYLHGSVVEGYAQPDSDVDIALVLMPGTELSVYECTRMELEIAAQIEKSCGIPESDVRSISQAPLMVQGRVITKGCLLYSRDEVFRVDYEVYTRKRYFDFKPVAEMMRDAFFQELRQEGVTRGKSG